MPIPYFVADSARVTILRPLASSAFGSYSLTLPEGIDLEDVHDFEAPGNELGHVATLTRSRRVGGLARRFVRADVAVTAADAADPDWFPESNVDAVLDEASTRVSSDFFLESDITKAGLGPWVPFVDFKVGDKARVNIWGHVVSLPITRIEPIISDHDVVDWLVHLGGQLVSDDDAREVENENLRKAFLQDRRELAGIEGQVKAVDKKAEDAKGTADEAKGTAEDAKSTADDALDAVNDADGLIQSSVEAANQASAESQAHSKRSTVFSGQSVVHSEQARQHSDKSAEYSDRSWDYSQESKDHAEDSYFWSDESSRHSADSQTYSQSASTHSLTSKSFSETSSDYSEASNQASLASQGSAEDASDHADWAEEYRRLAEVARNDAEIFRRDAEEARRLAELGRSDAEAARDRAEQSRKRAMQSMSAAEMMRALAEQERKKAELARADAEDDRKESEIARDAAEQARSEAEGHRTDAFNHMQAAFTANSGASQAAVDAALSAQESAEKALEAQMVGWRKFVHPGPHGLTLQDDRVGVTILPNGLSGQISYGDNAFWAGELFGKVYYTNNTVEPIYSKVPFASTLNFGGGNTPVKAVEVDYRDSQRKGMRSMDGLSTGWAVPANNAWYQYKTGRPWSVTVTHPTELTAVFSVGWDAAGHMGSYSIQARVNGTPVRTVKDTEFGPLFFWQGGGYRTQLLNISGANALQLKAGDTVSFWVIRERDGNTVVPGERKIRDFSLSVTWSEPA